MKKSIVLIVLFIMAHAPVASALPLLAQNAAQNISTALTLFPDHENPNLFYYFPDSSEFTRTGSTLPDFGLTYWRDGAYASFQMHLTSSPEQRAALEQFLRSRQGAGIAVLPVMRSTIGLTNSTNASAGALTILFSELNFPPQAGLAEHPVGVNAVLTAIGSRVFRAAIRNPMAMKLDYCYKIQGLGPDFHAVITADFRRVYEHFRAAGTVGTLFSRASLATEITRLRQNGAIRIEINGGNASDEEYARAIAERISERFFTPQLPANPTAIPPVAGWSFSSLQLGFTRADELRTERWELIRRDLVEREFCVPMSLTQLGPYASQLVVNAEELQ